MPEYIFTEFEKYSSTCLTRGVLSQFSSVTQMSEQKAGSSAKGDGPAPGVVAVFRGFPQST
jgi:hypothetical protein